MSTRERAATRAPTITPTSWFELAPGDCGGADESMAVEVKPEVGSVVEPVGGGVAAMVVAGGVEEMVAEEDGDTVDVGISGPRKSFGVVFSVCM